MKKITLFLSILFLSCVISSQKTVKVYNQTYVVNGDLVCEGFVGEAGNEKNPQHRVDCYAHLKDKILIYSRVFSIDKIVTLLEVYEVDISLLDLKNAKIDLELEYVCNPAFYCIQLNAIDNKAIIKYTEYDGKSAPLAGSNTKLNIDFNDEKKAKDYLKELKTAAKK